MLERTWVRTRRNSALEPVRTDVFLDVKHGNKPTRNGNDNQQTIYSNDIGSNLSDTYVLLEFVIFYDNGKVEYGQGQ